MGKGTFLMGPWSPNSRELLTGWKEPGLLGLNPSVTPDSRLAGQGRGRARGRTVPLCPCGRRPAHGLLRGQAGPAGAPGKPDTLPHPAAKPHALPVPGNPRGQAPGSGLSHCWAWVLAPRTVSRAGALGVCSPGTCIFWVWPLAWQGDFLRVSSCPVPTSPPQGALPIAQGSGRCCPPPRQRCPLLALTPGPQHSSCVGVHPAHLPASLSPRHCSKLSMITFFISSSTSLLTTGQGQG